MADVELVGVTQRFGAVRALDDLSLAVGDGELLVVVGPSGCGKTSALRIVAGLDRPAAGQVRIGGRDVTTVDPGDRNVSMVFQSHALFPHLSVRDNIGFGLAARRVPAAEAASRVRAAAGLAEAGDLLDRRPDELSGGERQRVALARALVREPAAFLLDEPLSNLDAQLRVQMRGEIRRLQRLLGATMLYVTHDQVEALTLGDRIAVLAAGRLQQVGAPDELYRRPANRFVARFVGSPAMNVLPADLEAVGLRFGPFVVGPPPLTRDGVALEAGVRPEDIAILGLAEPGPDDADGPPALEGSDLAGPPAVAIVDAVEPAGNETFVHLAAGPHRLVVRAGRDVRPAIGTGLRLGIAAGRVHVFDAATGERLG